MSTVCKSIDAERHEVEKLNLVIFKTLMGIKTRLRLFKS